ncbi:disulfide bond formation protein DsbA [Christiangramia fulva]|uniref:Disulfide bond formation protein DsbA n=1 Tax=Christiangramia fulva TaxID=2126553 RepID=A0A2R3ZB95_9FLAO|nr:DsbA family oxidoreductase [Christiangramia fulva]AVR47521.1 disulfide bond formation protein DsbA [Christiangramia fulva]
MQVKIWSDVRCPFCYIGKKKLEAALEKFPQRDEVEIIWKSFQLDPSLKTDASSSTLEYFVKTKGVSEEQARQMFSGAANMAKEAGINLNIEKGILANSFMAHRLIQLAKTKDLGNEIEEVLFKAHFEEAKNIDDIEVLVQLAESIGMETEEVRDTLKSDAFAYEVKQDEMEARNIGVRGVPFFVFEDKYAISGAQPTEAFLQTLEKVWEERNPELKISEGDSCSTDGTCD